MNKKLLIVIVTALILLLISVSIILATQQKKVATTQNQTTQPFGAGTVSGTNSGLQTTDSLKLTQTDGTTISVPDFTKGKSSVQEGSYTYYNVTNNQETLGDAAQFDIQYGTDNSITIVLLKEPLSASRLAAEEALRKLIPISDQQLCKLDVFVSTPASVSDAYGGESLGLSFCPDSVQLP